MKQETPAFAGRAQPRENGSPHQSVHLNEKLEEQLSIKFQDSELDMRTQHNSNIGTSYEGYEALDVLCKLYHQQTPIFHIKYRLCT